MGNSSNDIVAIIVTFNRKKLLKECIKALLNQNYKKCDILIIDNASNDGTKEYISTFIDNKKVFYQNTKYNLGGAGGFNYGIKVAYKMGYKYFWLMDDDTIVKNDSLTELVNAKNLLNDNFGFLSSVVLWTDGTICKINIPKIAKDWYNNVSHMKNGILKSNYASFVSFFVKREVVDEIGLPIKEFFIWCDDTEYSNRISKKYNSYIVTNSQVVHKTSSNNGSNITIENDKNRLNRYKYAFRNECVVARSNGIKGRLIHFLKVNYNIFNVIFKKNKNKLKKVFIIIFYSIIGCFFRPKVEYIDINNVKYADINFFKSIISGDVSED